MITAAFKNQILTIGVRALRTAEGIETNGNYQTGRQFAGKAFGQTVAAGALLLQLHDLLFDLCEFGRRRSGPLPVVALGRRSGLFHERQPIVQLFVARDELLHDLRRRSAALTGWAGASLLKEAQAVDDTLQVGRIRNASLAYPRFDVVQPLRESR